MLARNRARNNVSNTLEFLRPAKRRRVGDDPASMEVDGAAVEENATFPVATSARTDAIKVDRDVQMKYEVASVTSGQGLLKRTVHSGPVASSSTARDDGQGTGGIRVPKGSKRITLDRNMPTLERHPGLEERFRNIEDHLFVRYGVSSPPQFLTLTFDFLCLRPYFPCFSPRSP